MKVDEIKEASKYSCVGGPFGSDLSRKHYVEEAGVPVIRGTNLSNDRFHDEGFVFVSEEKADDLHRNLAYPGDLIFTQRGTLGQIALIPDDAKFPRYVVSQSQMKLVVDRDIADPYFVYVFFRSPLTKKFISDRAIIGGVPHINLGILKEIEVPVPTLDKQKIVVKIIRDLDRKIDNNRLTNETLEQIAQAIFKSWFVDFEPVKAKQHIRALGGNDEQTERAAQAVIAGAVNLDVITTATDLGALDQNLTEALSEKLAHQTDTQRKQLCTTANQFPDQLVESELGPSPAGWVVSAFSDIARNIRDTVDPTTLDGEMPYVGLEHIEKQQMHLAKWGHATDVASNKTRFARGDFLFGKLRPYFHKVCRPPIEGICSTDILVIRAALKNWEGFVQCQIFDSVFVEYANVRSTGTRMPRANWKDMGAYAIAKPCVEIAGVFSQLVGEFNRLASQNTWSCNSLVAVRDLLLPKLLSGEIKIGDHNLTSSA